jgi:hypothetical protein
MAFGGGVHRWKMVGRIHPSQNRGVQQINNQLIVAVTAILCCDWFCHATGIFCPRKFPPPNVISQTNLTSNTKIFIIGNIKKMKIYLSNIIAIKNSKVRDSLIRVLKNERSRRKILDQTFQTHDHSILKLSSY